MVHPEAGNGPFFWYRIPNNKEPFGTEIITITIKMLKINVPTRIDINDNIGSNTNLFTIREANFKTMGA